MSAWTRRDENTYEAQLVGVIAIIARREGMGDTWKVIINGFALPHLAASLDAAKTIADAYAKRMVFT